MGKNRKSAKGMSINAGTSKLDVLLNEGAEVLRSLHRLDGNRRLTPDAFLTAACRIADCSEEELSEFENRLDGAIGVDETRIFIRRMVMAFKPSTYPTPHSNLPKLLRCYGSDTVPGELGIMDGSLALCQAVAAKTVTKRFPELFGEITDFAAHEKKTRQLRTRLDHLYSKMTDAVSGADFVIDNSTLLPDEKKRGLALVSFRRAPGISFGMPDWPRLLVEDAERPIPRAEAKSNSIPRRQLDETTMAA